MHRFWNLETSNHPKCIDFKIQGPPSASILKSRDRYCALISNDFSLELKKKLALYNTEPFLTPKKHQMNDRSYPKIAIPVYCIIHRSCAPPSGGMKPETFKGSWWCGQHLGGGVLGGEYKTSLTVYHFLSKSTNLSMTWFCIRWFCHWGACMSLQPESVSTPNHVLLNMSDWTIWRVSNGFSPNCIDLREEAHNFPARLIQFSKRASAAWSLRGLTISTLPLVMLMSTLRNWNGKKCWNLFEFQSNPL